MSTDAHPIKVTNTAPSKNMSADEIVIETAKPGMVTVVVMVMSIFFVRNASRRVLIMEMRGLLVERKKGTIFLGGGIPRIQETFLRN